MRELSKMQQKIYEYIAACIREQGYPPSVREIGEAVGLKSPSTVHFHLKRLEEAGVIEKGAGKGRAITLRESPKPENQVPVVGNVAAGSPILAQECIEDYLTFDAGYENGCTPAILEALKKHHVPATFFVVGNYLETSPELVKQMIAEGHTVANHTYHHPDMSRISDKAAFEKELTALETLYQSVTGQTMKKYYRPPQGKYSESNLQMAKELGYKTFFWSLAYVDWMQDQQPSKEEAFSKLLTRIHPGAIVLLHSTSQTNAQILDELLAKWEEMGYQFGQLDEL